MTDHIDRVLAEHDVSAFSGDSTACACDRTWRPNAEHRAHLAGALREMFAAELHEALERAAEAVRLSAYPPRIVMGFDGSRDVAQDVIGVTMSGRIMTAGPDDIFRVDPPRRLCSLPPEDQDSADAAADELQRLHSIGQTRRDLISDDDWAWFCAHPLANTMHLAGIAPKLIEWLRA